MAVGKDVILLIILIKEDLISCSHDYFFFLLVGSDFASFCRAFLCPLLK